MTPKSLLTVLILLSGFCAHAQVPSGSGKLFIIEDSSRATLTSAPNPAEVLAQTDRVELTSNNQIVNVKRCGSLGCLDPVGQPVLLDVIHAVNHDVQAAALGDPDHGCRVCLNTKSIPTNLEDYVERIKAGAH